MQIEAKFAEIHWSEQEEGSSYLVDEVVIFDRRQPRRDRDELDNSAGACCADWMDGSDPRSTPEGVYMGWILAGFASPEMHLVALQELARIDQCVWAHHMAGALERHLRARS